MLSWRRQLTMKTKHKRKTLPPVTAARKEIKSGTVTYQNEMAPSKVPETITGDNMMKINEFIIPISTEELLQHITVWKPQKNSDGVASSSTASDQQNSMRHCDVDDPEKGQQIMVACRKGCNEDQGSRRNSPEPHYSQRSLLWGSVSDDTIAECARNISNTASTSKAGERSSAKPACGSAETSKENNAMECREDMFVLGDVPTLENEQSTGDSSTESLRLSMDETKEVDNAPGPQASRTGLCQQTEENVEGDASRQVERESVGSFLAVAPGISHDNMCSVQMDRAKQHEVASASSPETEFCDLALERWTCQSEDDDEQLNSSNEMDDLDSELLIYACSQETREKRMRKECNVDDLVTSSQEMENGIIQSTQACGAGSKHANVLPVFGFSPIPKDSSRSSHTGSKDGDRTKPLGWECQMTQPGASDVTTAVKTTKDCIDPDVTVSSSDLIKSSAGHEVIVVSASDTSHGTDGCSRSCKKDLRCGKHGPTAENDEEEERLLELANNSDGIVNRLAENVKENLPTTSTRGIAEEQQQPGEHRISVRRTQTSSFENEGPRQTSIKTDDWVEVSQGKIKRSKAGVARHKVKRTKRIDLFRVFPRMPGWSYGSCIRKNSSVIGSQKHSDAGNGILEKHRRKRRLYSNKDVLVCVSPDIKETPDVGSSSQQSFLDASRFKPRNIFVKPNGRSLEYNKTCSVLGFSRRRDLVPFSRMESCGCVRRKQSHITDSAPTCVKNSDRSRCLSSESSGVQDRHRLDNPSSHFVLAGLRKLVNKLSTGASRDMQTIINRKRKSTESPSNCHRVIRSLRTDSELPVTSIQSSRTQQGGVTTVGSSIAGISTTVINTTSSSNHEEDNTGDRCPKYSIDADSLNVLSNPSEISAFKDLLNTNQLAMKAHCSLQKATFSHEVKMFVNNYLK